MKDFSEEILEQWFKKNISGPCETICDNVHCYKLLQAVCHDKKSCLLFKKIHIRASFSWLHTVVNNIKTSIYDTFHRIDYEHYGYRYFGELQYRFHRRFDLKKIFYGLLDAAAHDVHAITFRPLTKGLDKTAKVR